MVYRRTARSEKAREASREAILGAARELLTQRGYDATTMQDVVRLAGTSIGNAYFYFANKDELLSEVIRRVIDELWAETAVRMLSIPAGPKRVAFVIHANIVAMLGDNVQVARAITAALDRITYLKDASLGRWRDILAECYPEMSDRERDLTASTIWGTNRTMGERLVNGSLNATPEEVASFSVRWTLRALGVPHDDIESALRFARRKVREGRD